MTKKQKMFTSLFVGLCLLFQYLPILVMVFFSFNSAKSLSSFKGFSLYWYQELFQNNEIMTAVFVSVSIAVIATIVSTLLGTITSIGLSKSKKIVRQMVLQLNQLPILNPDIVTAISLMLFFSALHLEKGYMTMLIAHIAFCTPFVIANVLPKVRQLDPNLSDAAMDLGATPFQALTKVIIPQIKPAIFAGALLAFTMSFDDFIISYFVTGNGVQNISIAVYNMSKRINPSINALSAIVVFVILIMLALTYIVPMVFNKPKYKKNTAFYVKVTAVVVAFSMVVMAIGNNVSKPTLRVFNWGEYIDKSVIKSFEKEFNCKVIYETFDSNESMYTKLVGGNMYDIMVPSDYMIEKMIVEELLQPIDWSYITNANSLDQSIMYQDFDKENNYWVPYFYGNVGIVYDTTKVDEEDLSEGWEILRNTKYKGNIYMYDSVRDSFMPALKALGYSMNSENDQEIEEAYQWLIEQKATMNPVYGGDSIIDSMKNSEKAMAVMYSGDAAAIMAENENMEFFLPDEGTNVWFDGFVISKDCTQVELAHQFINYMVADENALLNTLEVGYLTSNVKAASEASKEEYEGNSAYSIRTNLDGLDEVFKYQDNTIKEKYAKLWTKIISQ
ncbi:MAG: extracellular solute-binding protein [Erysipelotrichaceae bacterium]|nr:extracellular solute-binding protein [Erysipelotrichaceae bacterium]